MIQKLSEMKKEVNQESIDVPEYRGLNHYSGKKLNSILVFLYDMGRDLFPQQLPESGDRYAGYRNQDL